MRKKAKAFIILFGIAAAVVVSVILDRVTGATLNRAGYFTLMHPNSRELYDTHEFTVTADMSSQGLRNDPVTIPKPDGVYRTLAIGDSFTFGWGSEAKDTWVHLLMEKLRVKNRSIEIVNVGAPGLGVDGYVLACDAYAKRLEADAIIIGLYGTDDLYQAASWKQNRSVLVRIIRALWPTFTRMGSRIIIDPWFSVRGAGNPVVFSRVWSDWVKNYFISKPGALADIDVELRKLLTSGKVNPSLLKGASQDPEYITKLLDSGNMTYAAEAVKELFTSFKTRCSRTLPVLVVYVPSSETVSDYFFPYRTKFGFRVDPQLTVFRPDEAIRQVVEAMGWSFMSVLPEFRREPCISCYYPWDIHLTPKGNARIAEEVYNFTVRNNPFRL